MDNLELVDIIRIALLILIGIPLVFVLAGIVSRATRKKFSEHVRALLRKVIIYGGIGFLIVTVLAQAGFQLTALLGAAGIIGIAVGFASQTSVSNIISGIFLISEKPFAVGDVIQVGQTMGMVLSIDLLSVKVRTFDNRYVRMPNETLIKSELINITRFPIRRFDLTVGVAYKEDIVRVMRVLADVIDKNPYSLDEPEPIILFTNFGASSLDIFVGVWFAGQDFLSLRKTLLGDIKERFDAEGIEIPFPHVSVYTGSVTDPFPVRVVNETPQQNAAAN